LSRQSRRELPHSRRYSGLNSLLLHLLLTLLQFLQELFRGLNLLLSVLLLLLVVRRGRLIVPLISLVGLIVGLRVIGGIGRLICRFVLSVLTFDDNGISPSSCGGGHGRHRTRVNVLANRARLFGCRRRILGQTA
jgi:xanthosine utilization system XapX-like protein